MRVFLDTNVLVSAFASHGLCADLLAQILAQHTLITGEVVISELRRALRDKIKLPADTVAAIENLLRDQVVVPKPTEAHSLPVRDRNDASVLASAIQGKTDVFVTADADLLEVASRAPLPVLNPRGFWNLLRGGAGKR